MLILLTILACGDQSPQDTGDRPPGFVDDDRVDLDTEDSSPNDDTGWDTGDTGGVGPVDADGDGWNDEFDCDDSHADVYPKAPELCDGLDNDCDGELPANEQDLTGDGLLDCQPGDCGGEGMTWAWSTADADLGTVSVSCNAGDYGCDAYAGDTACSEVLPLLCLQVDGSSAPNGENNWAAGRSQVTAPMSGCQLADIAVADDVCRQLFGVGYRAAEFHDGGGWSMTTWGDWATEDRLWVDINNQPATCW